MRTPNFKRWFGNWDYDENAQVKVTDITGLSLGVDFKDTKALKKWLISNYAGQSVRIESDGSIVGFSSKKLNASLKRRGETQRSAYTALEDLIKNAVYFDFENNDGQDKHSNLAGQDVYYSAMKIGNEFYAVKFKFDTLKEDLSRTYKDHKVTEITISPLVYHTQTRINNPATYARTGDTLAFTLSDLTNGVNPENVSKVVDENGEPLVVYHGTDYGGFSVFNTFDIAGRNVGAFFSSEDRASWYAKASYSPEILRKGDGNTSGMYACFLNMKNPKIIDAEGEWAGHIDQLRDNEEQDGVIVLNVVDGTHDEGSRFEDTNYVVFNPEQIKSATDNIGTFDGNDPDIYYQAFSVRKSLLQRLKDWLRGKDIDDITIAGIPISATNMKITFDNEESERRYKEAELGVPEPTVPQKVKRFTSRLFKSFRGDFPELAGNREFDFAREEFRKLGRAKSAQIHKAMKTFTENLGNLSERQRDLFGRMRLLDDLMWRKSQVPDAELPFGFDDETLKKEHEKFTKLIQNEPGVQKAIQAEEQTMREISREFVELAGQLGLNLDGVFRNPHYYRHTILEYASMAARSTRGARQADSKFGGTLQDAIDEKLNEIKNRSFMKKYKGSALDINMNYTQAQGEVRAQMLMDIETMKTLLEIKKKYDKAPELREALKKAFTPPSDGNERHNQGEGANLSDIIPEGYALYNPAGSRLIQSANTAAENVLAMAIDDAAEETGLPLDEILNSMGANSEEFFNQLWIIPKEIKETLRNMSKGRDRGLLGNTAKAITTAWKKLVLFSPTRNLKYNFRNFTGDLDAVIAGNPNALKFFGQAVRELTAHFTKNKTTQDLKDYMERSGGMNADSMAFNDSEIKELQNMAEILKDEKASIPKKGWNLIKKFFANEVAFTQWREHILRYAAYLAYKQDMDNNKGTPSTWGASLKNEVMALSDNRDKAYKMSNELLGAYDQVSDTGKQLREMLIPFYSWMEVNMRRYYRLLKNGFSGQNSSDFTKRLLLGQSARVPFYALSAAETFGKIALLTMAIQAFNRMVFGDDDDELPNDVKYRPHLTLGKYNGKVYYFDRIGALADAADWLSLDSIFLDAKELANNQQTLGGYVKKMAQAPVNKVINGLNPILKMPIELATGRTMYPDAFNSRTIRDSKKYVAQSLGLAWPYKAVTGEPRSDWDELSRMLVYSLDPNEAAYFQTLDKVRQFQERVLDKKFDGFATTRRGQVLQNLKRAMRYGDKAAVRRYLKEYAKLDGTKKGLKQSMKAMNPLYGLSNAEKKQFLKWITADDRKYLNKANRYYHALADRYLR